MALYKFIEDDNVQIAVWQIAETEQELTSLVGIDYSKSYASTHRRLERLATRALLNHLGYNETIEYQESGKPYLPNRKVDISISHAGEFVAVGLCKTRSIGVDIENINRKYTAVTSKYLSLNETAWMNKNDQRSLALAWCIKESVYKMNWVDFKHFNKDINIHRFNDLKDRGEISVSVLDQNLSNKLTLKYLFFDNYCLTWGCK